MFKVKDGILIGNKQITGEGMTEVLTAMDVGDMAFQDSAGVSVGAFIADTMTTTGVNSFTKPQAASTVTLTHNTAWDGNDKQHLLVTVNGSNFTIANPSSFTSGVYYSIFVRYSTAHTLSFGNMFKGIGDVSPTALVGAKDHFVFRADGDNVLCLIGASYNIGI